MFSKSDSRRFRMHIYHVIITLLVVALVYFSIQMNESHNNMSQLNEINIELRQTINELNLTVIKLNQTNDSRISDITLRSTSPTTYNSNHISTTMINLNENNFTQAVNPNVGWVSRLCGCITCGISSWFSNDYDIKYERISKLLDQTNHKLSEQSQIVRTIITELHVKTQNQDITITELKASKKILEIEILDLEGKIDDAHDELQLKSKQLQNGNETIQELQKDINEIYDVLNESNRMLNRTTLENEQLQHKINLIRFGSIGMLFVIVIVLIKCYQYRINKLKLRIKSIETRHKSLKTKYESLESEINEKCKQYENINKLYENMKYERNNIQKQNNELKYKYNKLQRLMTEKQTPKEFYNFRISFKVNKRVEDVYYWWAKCIAESISIQKGFQIDTDKIDKGLQVMDKGLQVVDKLASSHHAAHPALAHATHAVAHATHAVANVTHTAAHVATIKSSALIGAGHGAIAGPAGVIIGGLIGLGVGYLINTGIKAGLKKGVSYVQDKYKEADRSARINKRNNALKLFGMDSKSKSIFDELELFVKYKKLMKMKNPGCNTKQINESFGIVLAIFTERYVKYDGIGFMECLAILKEWYEKEKFYSKDKKWNQKYSIKDILPLKTEKIFTMIDDINKDDNFEHYILQKNRNNIVHKLKMLNSI